MITTQTRTILVTNIKMDYDEIKTIEIDLATVTYFEISWIIHFKTVRDVSKIRDSYEYSHSEKILLVVAGGVEYFLADTSTLDELKTFFEGRLTSEILDIADGGVTNTYEHYTVN